MSRRSVCALIAGACGLAASAGADIITQWNFNSSPADANTATGTTTPNIGTGTLSLLGGTTATFASGDASGGSTDPAAGDDSGYNLTTFAAQGTESGLRGLGAATGTTGFQDIVITWDQRYSNTSSRWTQFEYTIDGGMSWVLFGPAIENTLGGDRWVNGNSRDLTGVAGVDNNPDFGFRFVSVFQPGTGAYQTSNPTSTYGATHTWRFDMVTVNGNLIPTPGAAALLGLGVMIAGRRRR